MTASTKDITIESLIESGLLHRETCEKHSHRIPHLDDILAGAKATEPDSTRFLTLADGPLEQAVLGYFCDVAGIPEEDRGGLRLLSGSEFRLDSGVIDQRSIDLVAARREKDNLGERGGKIWKAAVAIEAKYGAAVNDGHKYCKKDPDSPRYSNQVICYSHGCIDQRLGADVAFVWLANPVDPELHAKYGPWADKGINQNDLKYEVLNAAYPDQQLAMDRWKSATWVNLGQAITTALELEGFATEAAAIVRFLRAGGPSEN